MQLTDLDKPIDELVAAMPHAGSLAELQTTLNVEKATLKRRGEIFDALLLRLYGDSARNAYHIAQKDTGTVHIPASNTLTLTVETDKNVKWDSATLRAGIEQIAREHGADAAQHYYGKLKLELGEKDFDGALPAVKTILQRARTLKPGKMKFTFKAMEGA